jgi:hypothetical protein
MTLLILLQLINKCRCSSCCGILICGYQRSEVPIAVREVRGDYRVDITLVADEADIIDDIPARQLDYVERLRVAGVFTLETDIRISVVD